MHVREGTARKYSNAAASQHDRQQPKLAGMTVKRPAAPLVRDEEAHRNHGETPRAATER